MEADARVPHDASGDEDPPDADVVADAAKGGAGGDAATRDSATPDSNTVDTATTPDTATGDVSLCNGEPGLRFYAARGGSGSLVLGSGVLYENGTYLAVNGDCKFWAYGYERVNGVGVTGTFSEKEASTLADIFHLSELASLEATYERQLWDGPQDVFSLGGRFVRIVPGCPSSSTCRNFDDFDVVQDLTNALVDGLEVAFAAGTELDGPVRFMLVLSEASVTTGPNYRQAPPWPLEGDPRDVAITLNEQGDPENYMSHRVSGPDADALRTLRTKWLDREIGLVDVGFIPIREPDDTLFELYVRDECELEDADGRMPFEW